MASDIKTCQSKGKLVTLSLGGATGSVGFGSDSQAQDFAQTVWDLFFGGSSDMRPFGDAILDGVDLDIEGGGSSGYVAFLTKLQSLSGSKKLYVTAAPQCVFPDASLSGVLNAFPFDAVYGKMSLSALSDFRPDIDHGSNWDFGLWDDWARHTSPNPNVKIYIGAPADSTSAGSGYVPPDTLASIAKSMRTSFPSFGGSMLWDSSSAFANNRYDLAIKTAMRAAGGTGFTFPACSAPAFVPGNNYPGGSTVSFGGYIWQSKWFSNAQPSNSPFGDWSAISACSGNGGSATSTTTAPPSGPTAGSCSNVAAWSSSTIYSTPGTEVTFNGHLYTNNWWTQGDSPTGQSGAWTDKGACTSSRLRNSRFFRL
ncbi:hypothetical protein D9758_000069 [Tetrapyrgos nigripes]|uniref:chitinase n=1 Tax=Tetrapyrgos nigripes TaxID=182062 RepID=A0A8H5H2A1_9AGAR|nr:hypothetical protein D9758_000069 [Tetrapyrgos nigripes]